MEIQTEEMELLVMVASKTRFTILVILPSSVPSFSFTVGELGAFVPCGDSFGDTAANTRIIPNPVVWTQAENPRNNSSLHPGRIVRRHQPREERDRRRVRAQDTDPKRHPPESVRLHPRNLLVRPAALRPDS